jgi:hypothetical protein
MGKGESIMALTNEDGLLVSYECSDLISELEADIKEFGNFKAYAYYKRKEGVKVYTDYDFHEDSVEGEPDHKDDNYDVVDAKYLLKYFKKQNSVL